MSGILYVCVVKYQRAKISICGVADNEGKIVGNRKIQFMHELQCVNLNIYEEDWRNP